MKKAKTQPKQVERVQINARMEKTIVKVLKGLAEYLNLSLNDLLKKVTLHALEGKAPFSKETLAQVERLKTIYDLDLTAADSHQLIKAPDARP